MSLRFRIEQLLSQLRWLGYLIRMHPRHLLGEVFQVCHTVRRPQDRPRTQWRDYIAWPGLVKPSCPLGWTRGRGWSSGWMDEWLSEDFCLSNTTWRESSFVPAMDQFIESVGICEPQPVAPACNTVWHCPQQTHRKSWALSISENRDSFRRSSMVQWCF